MQVSMFHGVAGDWFKVSVKKEDAPKLAKMGFVHTPRELPEPKGDSDPDYSAMTKEQLIEIVPKANKADVVKINAAVSEDELTDGKVGDMRTELLGKLNEGE
ncbi:MAG: hypothetical protein CML03_00845 [Pseudooceanicola sp.]|nr:hypothetical protein [Pseudooceanicola sp.]|tara:strand:- start:5877 stop:6182 length:306 start_codon:yes stop_codon:yes gene_type:complete